MKKAEVNTPTLIHFNCKDTGFFHFNNVGIKNNDPLIPEIYSNKTF